MNLFSSERFSPEIITQRLECWKMWWPVDSRGVLDLMDDGFQEWFELVIDFNPNTRQRPCRKHSVTNRRDDIFLLTLTLTLKASRARYARASSIRTLHAHAMTCAISVLNLWTAIVYHPDAFSDPRQPFYFLLFRCQAPYDSVPPKATIVFQRR